MINDIIKQKLAGFQSELIGIELPDNTISFTCSAEDLITRGQAEGIPLIRLCPPVINAAAFLSAFNQIGSIIKKYHPDLTAEIDRIEGALPSGQAEQELFVSSVFNAEGDLSGHLEEKVDPEILGLLLGHTSKLFMREYGKAAGSLYDPGQWQKGMCPVCGGRPHLALLEKDTGKRYLYCALCEIEWRFRRLGCPYCNSNESHYFTVEGLDQYRMFYCDRCHGYLKALDGNKTTGQVDLFQESSQTVQLDITALREGYFNQ